MSPVVVVAARGSPNFLSTASSSNNKLARLPRRRSEGCLLSRRVCSLLAVSARSLVVLELVAMVP